jgi:hypothetical protein
MGTSGMDMDQQTDRNQEPSNLEQLLDRMAQADADGNGPDQETDADNKEVTLDAILDEVGHRSFGSMLLVAGLVTVAPIIGDIPGVPSVMGLFVLLTAGQILLHREHIWLPDWLLDRSVEHDKFCKALEWLRPAARFIDRGIRPRLTWFTQEIGLHVIAAACIVIAAATPAMELVPFSANGAGAALTAFGLSLIAHDGLLAVLALAITTGTLGVVVYNLV